MARTPSSRKRLIDAATELFLSQGFGLTTTRQIADRAQVNEATLFRNFGSKHDLLLAVIDQAGMVTRMHDGLTQPGDEVHSLESLIRQYSRDRFNILVQHAELLRALVGEAGQYSVEQQRALSEGMAQSTQDLAQSLEIVITQEQIPLRVSSETLAALLNNVLYGCVVAELISEFQPGWADHERFIDAVTTICLGGAIAHPSQSTQVSDPPSLFGDDSSDGVTPPTDRTDKRIADLPATVVRAILQQAKKQGAQTYAITYLLFGAGVLPGELIELERSHHIANSRQQLVQINQGAVRQVPVNQWIMGKRYGSYTNNPLTQWLKSRKDDASHLFLTDQGQKLSLAELMEHWQNATEGILAPDNRSPHIGQARQTWCVEMLMKGLNADDLSLLSGWTTTQLQPYVRRAREKAALERALELDQK